MLTALLTTVATALPAPAGRAEQPDDGAHHPPDDEG
jgi:hypothetical protein